MSHCHSKSECGCHSSHHSCGEGSCSCKKSSSCGGECSCKNQGCSCKQCCGDHYASKFLELADCAWLEVLKEKIKEHIKANDQHLDELARIIAEANREKWKKKMENNQCSGSFEDKLSEFFGHSCSTHGKQGNQQESRANQSRT